MLRRLRNRIGIRAPRVSIRTHVPWHWRALSITLLTAIALAVAGWIYDAGRRFAGFDQTESAQEITTLRERLAKLESELTQTRKVADASESNLRIDRVAQQQLSAQVKTLEADNVRLKEDLAFFESMAQGGATNDAGAGISRLLVEPTGAAGSYQYRLLLSQLAGKKDKDFKGSYQLTLSIQQSGNGAMIVLPKAGDADVARYQLSFRHFRRVEGTFTIPPGTRLQAVEAKLLQEGAVKASQRIQF